MNLLWDNCRIKSISAARCGKTISGCSSATNFDFSVMMELKIDLIPSATCEVVLGFGCKAIPWLGYKNPVGKIAIL